MACRQTARAVLLVRNSVIPARALSTCRRAISLASPPMLCPRHIPSFSAGIQSNLFIHTSSQAASKHIVNIQDEKDFDARVLKNDTPVIVDFFANWCGPCKLLIPRLESLVAGKDGKVILAKIDIDEMQDLAMNYGVEAVPTVIGMKNGKVIDKFVGLKDDADLETFVQKLMK